jgi:pimeloyl-ACP methyl ester carboxylesterase
MGAGLAILASVAPCLAADPDPGKGALNPDYLTLQQLRARYGEPDARYMTIKGVEIHYKDEGTGPAILMIHGSSSALNTYDGEAKILCRRFRVIRYDIPNWGLSGSLTDAVMASGVRAEDFPELLLTNLGVKSATVVGVSSGGTTAYYLAAKRPDLVERLVISNAPADPVSYAGMKVSKALLAEEAIAGRQDQESFKRRSYWDAFFDYEAGEPERISPAVREFYYDNNRRVPEKNRNDGFALTRDNALTRSTAARVVCPVLLVWGERDALLPPAAADVLAGYLMHADVSKLLLPDVGHYPPLEVPDRYAAIIAAYIDAVTPVKPRSPPPGER